MRQIKFRGKRKDTDEWVYGYYAIHHISLTDIDRKTNQEIRVGTKTVHSIFNDEKKNENGYWKDVDPETVGQFTGLHDTNGKEIYEGDILQYIGRGADIVGKIYYREVTFKEGSFCIYCKDLNIHSPMSGYITNGVLGWDVVGNIHDTPELLKGGKE